MSPFPPIFKASFKKRRSNSTFSSCSIFLAVLLPFRPIIFLIFSCNSCFPSKRKISIIILSNISHVFAYTSSISSQVTPSEIENHQYVQNLLCFLFWFCTVFFQYIFPSPPYIRFLSFLDRRCNASLFLHLLFPSTRNPICDPALPILGGERMFMEHFFHLVTSFRCSSLILPFPLIHHYLFYSFFLSSSSLLFHPDEFCFIQFSFLETRLVTELEKIRD